MAITGLTALVPDNYPANTRILTDTAMSATIALPAAAGTANTGAIDLQNITPYPTTETINVYVATTASASGNSVNGTIVLQDSADNSTWANIPTLGSSQITQGASATVAVNATYKLPPVTRRYIRAQGSLPSNTANLADSSLTIQLLF